MGNIRQPRSGTMQFWPRKRAKRAYARVRSWSKGIKDVKPLGFAGYKAAMTHITFIDNRPNSMTKGEEIVMPVTVVECPPIKVISARFYKNSPDGLRIVSEVRAEKQDKELSRKIPILKKVSRKLDDIKDFDDVRILVQTQPRLTGIGKKKPELFELAISGSREEQLKFAAERLGKELNVSDIFKPGSSIDAHAVTKGKGYQGPVKRFGISLRAHKSEKTKRGPGSLGAWKAQGHMMYRIAHAGQMGYHLRTEFNKLLVKLFDDPKQISPRSGFPHYGAIRNSAVLLKGSIPGPAKRLVIMTHSIRPNHKIPSDEPNVNYIRVM